MAAGAFQAHASDNVVTLLADAECGPLRVIGTPDDRALELSESVRRGHKVALRAISVGEALVKFGVRIGHATAPIRPGDWVHLQNCASDFDERSSTLTVDTGASTDMVYE